MIEVYNLSGTKVADINGKLYPEGKHEIVIDASGLEPGVYIYHFIHDGKREIRKMYLSR